MVNNLHPCFANMAKLKLRMSLKPKPPSFFDWTRDSQLFQCIFFSSPLWPHQNLAHIMFNSLQSFTGSRNTPIVYVGIDWATAFIRTSFPSCSKAFDNKVFKRIYILCNNYCTRCNTLSMVGGKKF